jgi:DNA-binding transcriptional ArsR family regulator
MSASYIDIEKLDCMVNRIKALTHPDRIAMLELLEKKERASVGEIQSHLNLEQASTSNHLRILRDQHIVIAKRAGKNKYYSINHTVLAEIISCISRCA